MITTKTIIFFSFLYRMSSIPGVHRDPPLSCIGKSSSITWVAAVIACSAALLVLLAPAVQPVPACRISEYPCRNNHCVRLDRYCDGHDDCGDASDEPAYCTGKWMMFNIKIDQIPSMFYIHRSPNKSPFYTIPNTEILVQYRVILPSLMYATTSRYLDIARHFRI